MCRNILKCRNTEIYQKYMESIEVYRDVFTHKESMEMQKIGTVII